MGCSNVNDVHVAAVFAGKPLVLDRTVGSHGVKCTALRPEPEVTGLIYNDCSTMIHTGCTTSCGSQILNHAK